MSFGRPKKRFSQNFLIDEKIAYQIVDCLQIKKDDTVFEIGTGRGILTSLIAAIGCRLFSFELDYHLIEKIQPQFKDHNQVTIVNSDFLKVRPDQYHDGPFKLIGNIPYDITSPLLEWVVRYHDLIPRTVLTTQKELADRISSGPGSKNWAPISIFTQCFFDIEYAFTIQPESFYPPPKVKSATIILNHNPKYNLDAVPSFRDIVRQSFKQRRKQMINNLNGLYNHSKERWQELILSTGLSADVRAEQVSIEQFKVLAEAVEKSKNS